MAWNVPLWLRSAGSPCPWGTPSLDRWKKSNGWSEMQDKVMFSPNITTGPIRADREDFLYKPGRKKAETVRGVGLYQWSIIQSSVSLLPFLWSLSLRPNLHVFFFLPPYFFLSSSFLLYYFTDSLTWLQSYNHTFISCFYFLEISTSICIGSYHLSFHICFINRYLN